METFHESKNASLLNLEIGDKIIVRGFVMLKGLDGGKKYKVVDKDDYSYTFTTIRGNKKVRHHSYQIHNSMRSLTDLNGIETI